MDDALAPILIMSYVTKKEVLILVVMDDALALLLQYRKQLLFTLVLILVVMDDALAPPTKPTLRQLKTVLILVVMDDALARYVHYILCSDSMS